MVGGVRELVKRWNIECFELNGNTAEDEESSGKDGIRCRFCPIEGVALVRLMVGVNGIISWCKACGAVVEEVGEQGVYSEKWMVPSESQFRELKRRN